MRKKKKRGLFPTIWRQEAFFSFKKNSDEKLSATSTVARVENLLLPIRKVRSLSLLPKRTYLEYYSTVVPVLFQKKKNALKGVVVDVARVCWACLSASLLMNAIQGRALLYLVGHPTHQAMRIFYKGC